MILGYAPKRGSGSPRTPSPEMLKREPRCWPSSGKRGKGGRAMEVTNKVSKSAPPNARLVTFRTGVLMMRSTVPSGS